MIRIDRGAEPAELARMRATKLASLGALGRAPTSDDIVGYREVARHLWEAQHYKCCYCEQKVQLRFNDVEHYRPKCRADRRPGCSLNHGYWWLAFSWDNLLFACPGSNRSEKNDLFPLAIGSTSLQPTSPPPGMEHPLLLDPGSLVNPVEHIEYVEESIGKTGTSTYWWARPRALSIYGNQTIEVCGLNHSDLRDLRNDYYRTVISRQIRALTDALDESRLVSIQREFDRAIALLEPESIFVGFTYDALRASIPDSRLKKFKGLRWPLPSQVC